MPTTLQLVEQALGRDKFAVLACAIDLMQERLDAMTREQPIDEQIAVLDVHELARENGVSFETLRKKISEVMGPHAVFRLGKRWVDPQADVSGLPAADGDGDGGGSGGRGFLLSGVRRDDAPEGFGLLRGPGISVVLFVGREIRVPHILLHDVAVPILRL